MRTDEGSRLLGRHNRFQACWSGDGTKETESNPVDASQIDAIHTDRDSGESVMSIARRFEVSRMTVWGEYARITERLAPGRALSLDTARRSRHTRQRLQTWHAAQGARGRRTILLEGSGG